jgi:Flp pilus assembly protein TadG
MVVPLFLLMLFGFIEIALITASISAFNFGAKDAARLGALVGPTDPNADSDMENLIHSRVDAVVVAKVVEIEIYKSDASGGYLLAGNTLPPEDAYDANRNPVAGIPTLWPVASRNDTLLDADFLGVRITYSYTYLTSFLSGGASTLQLVANSVQRIEPQDFQSYHALPARLALVREPGAGAGWSKGSGGSGTTSGPDTPVADVRRWMWGGAA